MFHSSSWILLVAILITWPLTVKGQAFCMKHSDFVAEIAREFQERLVGFGILSDKRVIGVFASSRGATFTVALTTPEGLTCPIGAGNNWRHVSPPLPDMKIFYPG
jgi:hypothetical protein